MADPSGGVPMDRIDRGRSGAEMTGHSLPGKGDTVLVYGLGRSGRAAARLLTARGCRVLVHDDDPETLAGPDLPGAPLAGGPGAAAAAGVRLAVMSPGIPPTASGPSALAASGITLVSELELAWSLCGAPCVVVTGTNGKSSTTVLVTRLLEAAGMVAEAVGNIGIPFAAIVHERAVPPAWYVVEASSFQLALSPALRPSVAVYTNFAPDHLDWHGSEAAYAGAKASMALRQEPSDAVVIPLDAGPLTTATSPGRGRRVTLGGPGSGAVVELDPVSGRGTLAGSPFDLDGALPGLPYMWRLVSCALHATLGVAAALGLPFDAVVGALRLFRPLEHRLEEAGRVGPVRFINDSKATNVDAVQYALRMCPGPLVLLLGGRHKGTSYRELVPFFGGKVASVVALGEARELVARDLAGVVPVHVAEGFEPAMETALELARPLSAGGVTPTVLFSPACSSYDMFENFEDRGRQVKAWVARRGEAP